MFELLLTSNIEKRTEYGWSGPGPKYLRSGDENLGYFGPIQSTELFTVAQLNDQAPSAGATLLADSGWLKFFYKGKILFIAMKHHRSTISWNGLYTSGLVYGIDGTGGFPGVNTPTNQLKIVTKPSTNDSWSFKVRCIGAANREQPVTTNETQTSEWNMLITPVRQVSGTVPGPWDNYTDVDLALATGSYGWETISGSTSACFRSRPSDLIQPIGKADTSRVNFRPVLELIPNV